MNLLNNPAAWKGDELLKSKYWNYHLSPKEIGEIESILDNLKTSNKEAIKFNQLQKTLIDISEELENGRGTVLLKGIPVDRYSDTELAEFHLILCQQMGIPIRQSGLNWDSHKREKTQFVTYIRAEASSSENGKQSTDAFGFHTDRYDVLSLLCVRQARIGGENRLASAITIYNEMLQSHPEIAESLFQEIPWVYEGEGGWINYPIWQIHKGKFTTQLSGTYARLSQFIEGAPRLSEQHKQGLDLLQTIGSEVGTTFKLKPGDWLMVNNHLVYHARASWEVELGDYDRLLLRVCFSPRNSRELPNTNPFKCIWRSVEAGQPRGGYLPNYHLPPDQPINSTLSENEAYWLDRYLKVRWVGAEQIK
jgi:hypothetical protein